MDNYGFKGEDFPLLGWQELLTEYDRPVIFGYDEIQNEFNSRDYKNFPYELVRLLTQNRKGHGKQIIGTAQRYARVESAKTKEYVTADEKLADALIDKMRDE